MTFATIYNSSDRGFFDIKTFLMVVRFITVNAILAFIFLFLAIEELDWSIASSREITNDIIIDNTSWNLKTLF